MHFIVKDSMHAQKLKSDLLLRLHHLVLHHGCHRFPRIANVQNLIPVAIQRLSRLCHINSGTNGFAMRLIGFPHIVLEQRL